VFFASQFFFASENMDTFLCSFYSSSKTIYLSEPEHPRDQGIISLEELFFLRKSLEEHDYVVKQIGGVGLSQRLNLCRSRQALAVPHAARHQITSIPALSPSQRKESRLPRRRPATRRRRTGAPTCLGETAYDQGAVAWCRAGSLRSEEVTPAARTSARVLGLWEGHTGCRRTGSPRQAVKGLTGSRWPRRRHVSGTDRDGHVASRLLRVSGDASFSRYIGLLLGSRSMQCGGRWPVWLLLV
jgi:hypothetical protein